MPKFYVYDGLEKTIINADSPLQACFRAIKHISKHVPVNGLYKVSEQGFEDHDDDVIFSSEEVIQALLDIMRQDNEKGYTSKQKKLRRRRKNRKKDEDGD